ncbi:hypothetical protein D3C78_1726380 [compost metagenome]
MKPLGSSHNTFRKPGLISWITPPTANGSRVRIHADSLPSADSTRMVPYSFSRARINALILPSSSARLPPVSRWISTAITI